MTTKKALCSMLSKEERERKEEGLPSISGIILSDPSMEKVHKQFQRIGEGYVERSDSLFKKLSSLTKRQIEDLLERAMAREAVEETYRGEGGSEVGSAVLSFQDFPPPSFEKTSFRGTADAAVPTPPILDASPSSSPFPVSCQKIVDANLSPPGQPILDIPSLGRKNTKSIPSTLSSLSSLPSLSPHGKGGQSVSSSSFSSFAPSLSSIPSCQGSLLSSEGSAPPLLNASGKDCDSSSVLLSEPGVFVCEEHRGEKELKRKYEKEVRNLERRCLPREQHNAMIHLLRAKYWQALYLCRSSS